MLPHIHSQVTVYSLYSTSVISSMQGFSAASTGSDESNMLGPEAVGAATPVLYAYHKQMAASPPAFQALPAVLLLHDLLQKQL